METAVVVTHRPTGLSAQASELRSQDANRRRAFKRLRLKLAIEYRVKTYPDAHPTAMWQSRLRKGRITINPEHEDFPTLLSEALDVLAMDEHHFPASAKRLGCTPTQLLKLIKAAPHSVLAGLNQHRQELGLHPLS